MTYDSTEDTQKHIELVRGWIVYLTVIIQARATRHDASKLQDPEKTIFDEFTPKLKDTTYGSDEYKGYLKEMKPALDHHYANNRHHPEYYSNGITGMNLVDLLEMLCDWKAATERHADGNIERSLVINQKRFGISDQLQMILENTVRDLLD